MSRGNPKSPLTVSFAANDEGFANSSENQRLLEIIEDDSELATAGMASSIVNILNTLLGAGMLALPEAIAASGLIPGLVSIFVMGAISAFGLILLSRCAAKIGRDSSFSAVAKITFPRMAIVFDLAIAVKCFGVALSYLVIIGDLMPTAVMSLSGNSIPADSIWMKRNFWITAFMAVILPFSFMRRMDSLKYTSSVALLAVIYLVFLITYNYFDTEHRPLPAPGTVKLWDMKFAFFTALPVYVFSFTCHQNMFSVYNEMKRNTPVRVNTTIIICLFATILTYLTVGALGYLSYGSASKSNILLNLDENSVLVTIARLAISVLVAFTFPIQCHPCRASFDKFLISCRELCGPSANAFGQYEPVETLPEGDEQVLDASGKGVVPVRPREMSTPRFIIITSCIAFFAYVISLNVTSLGIVLSLVGATGSTTICYILPGLFYVKITQGQPWNLTRILAALLLVYGLIAMPVCITFVLMKGS